MTWLLLNLSLQIQFSFAILCVLLSISPIAGRLYPLIARIWRCQAEMHLFSNEPSCFTSKTCVVTVRIEAAVSGLLRTTEPHERRYGYGQLILLSFLETRLAISNFSWWSLSQFFSCMFIRPRGHWVRNLDQIVIISKLNGYFLKASEQIGSSAIFLWGTLVWSHVSAILRRTPIKGDFNEMECIYEKIGGHPLTLKKVRRMRDFLDTIHGESVPNSGRWFTWKKIVHGHLIYERLDRPKPSLLVVTGLPTHHQKTARVCHAPPRPPDSRFAPPDSRTSAAR